jgi:hypothetical protein
MMMQNFGGQRRNKSSQQIMIIAEALALSPEVRQCG